MPLMRFLCAILRAKAVILYLFSDWSELPMEKLQPHAIFCIPSTKYRSRKSRPEITVANRIHESISIEIVRLQKIANRSRKSRTCM